jgi:hypothetical protein
LNFDGSRSNIGNRFSVIGQFDVIDDEFRYPNSASP